MPSTVWCARAQYVVRQSVDEVYDHALGREFIYVDALGYNANVWEDRGRVLLRVAAISAVEPYDDIDLSPSS